MRIAHGVARSERCPSTALHANGLRPLKAPDRTRTKGPDESSSKHLHSAGENQSTPDPTIDAALGEAPCESTPLVLGPDRPGLPTPQSIGKP
jgi:hypothetical protein